MGWDANRLGFALYICSVVRVYGLVKSWLWVIQREGCRGWPHIDTRFVMRTCEHQSKLHGVYLRFWRRVAKPIYIYIYIGVNLNRRGWESARGASRERAKHLETIWQQKAKQLEPSPLLSYVCWFCGLLLVDPCFRWESTRGADSHICCWVEGIIS